MFSMSTHTKIGLLLGVLALLSACNIQKEDVPPGILAPPTDVQVTPQRDQILITWQDNSPNETGFTVYRDTLGDGSDAFAKRAELPADTVRFADTDIQVGASYRYAVAANGDGFRSPKIEQEGDAVAPTPNSAPEADAQERSTPKGAAVTLQLSGADPDEDRLSFSIETQPQHGSLGAVKGDGEVVYMPDAGFTGKDGFSFRVSDGVSKSAPATVTLTVGADNTPPVAKPGRVVTQSGEAVTIALDASDAEGDDLEYLIETEPEYGSLKLDQLDEGSVVYTPDIDSSGEDSFRFKVNDGLDDSEVEEVIIRTNQAPSVAKEVSGQAVYRLDSFDLDISRVFSDKDEDALELSADGLPASLKVSEGRLQGKPGKDEIGTYEVTLAAQDGWGGSASTSFTLWVAETCPFDRYEVTFADDNLRRKVNAALGLSASATPTCRQMEGLTELVALGSSTNKIVSLNGLEHARNLTSLNLANNQVEDISVLGELTNLTVLDLGGNVIRDLTPLAQLTELTNLQLGRNEVVSINALADLTKLNTLNLTSNDVSNINPLSDLTGLTSLILSNNALKDEECEDKSKNCQEANSIEALSSLTQLIVLKLDDNEIKNLTSLRRLTQLRELYLESNRISNIAPLEGLIYLRILNLSSNEVVKVDGLRLMVRLEDLKLNNNKIRSISEISNLVFLRELNLANNKIEEVKALSKLPRLQKLLMSENFVVGIYDLGKLTELTELNLSSNRLEKLWGLNKLHKLNVVDLGDNVIDDISPLIGNSGLGEGDTVKLYDNSDIDPERIKELEAKGVEVKLNE